MDDGLGFTTITLTYGDLSASIESPVKWSPEVVDHVLTRVRRQLVATARQLNMVTLDGEGAEDD